MNDSQLLNRLRAQASEEVQAYHAQEAARLRKQVAETQRDIRERLAAIAEREAVLAEHEKVMASETQEARVLRYIREVEKTTATLASFITEGGDTKALLKQALSRPHGAPRVHVTMPKFMGAPMRTSSHSFSRLTTP
jgi:hypothetical protein